MNWVYLIWNLDAHLADAWIQAKARKIWNEIYSAVNKPFFGSQFSADWLHRFKKLNKFR